jgi:cysteine desulfurase family protein (TIGR01976 family)
MTTLDVEQIRKRFPGLQRDFGGRPAIFADAPGGTQVPQSVIDAMADYLANSNANEHGAFVTSAETDAVIDGARGAAADLLGCSPDEVVFGPNMTTLAFALSRALARTLRPGDEVVVSSLDHDANIAPWTLAAEDAGADVKWVDFDPADCTLDLDSLETALSERTRIVAFTLASNAVGTIPPAAEVVERVRAAGDALVIADAVHYTPHRLVDVGSLGVDFLFCSPYKFFGPHLGVMYGARELLEEIRSYKVRPAPDESPASWETGTRNHEGLAGLTACVDYIASLTDAEGDRRTRIVAAAETIAEHEAGLSLAFLEAASELRNATIYGIADRTRIGERTPTFALRIDGESPLATAERLGERGIFVWDGNYYAVAVMERLGLEETDGAVRIGFCHYHSVEDVVRAADALPS